MNVCLSYTLCSVSFLYPFEICDFVKSTYFVKFSGAFVQSAYFSPSRFYSVVLTESKSTAFSTDSFALYLL